MFSVTAVSFLSPGTVLHCKFAVTLMQESCIAVRILRPSWRPTLCKVSATLFSMSLLSFPSDFSFGVSLVTSQRLYFWCLSGHFPATLFLVSLLSFSSGSVTSDSHNVACLSLSLFVSFPPFCFF